MFTKVIKILSSLAAGNSELMLLIDGVVTENWWSDEPKAGRDYRTQGG